MRILIFSIVLLAFTACTKKTSDGAGESVPSQASDLVARGKTVYMSNCTACHSANPKVDGSLGPAVYGSSLELLEHRVLNGDYPPGYTPKRPTKQMVPLRHLKPDIPALHAYLNAP